MEPVAACQHPGSSIRRVMKAHALPASSPLAIAGRKAIGKTPRSGTCAAPCSVAVRAAARGFERGSLAARSDARLVGRRVLVPCNSADPCSTVCVRSNHEGTIVAVCAGRCLVDLPCERVSAAAPPCPPNISMISVMQWAAMANKEADEPLSELKGLSVGGGPDVTSKTSGASGGSHASPAVTGGSDQTWHPTWRVRRWLLPDVDSLSMSLATLS